MSLACATVCAASIATAVPVQGDGADVETVDLAGDHELARALDRGLGHGPVPGNLAPSLAQAADDVPTTTKDGCHLPLLTVDQPATCTYGWPAATRTMVLFGDSHAEQWFGALDAYARRSGWQLVSWTKVACPLSSAVIVNKQLGRRYTECERWRENRISAIGKLRPDLVVTSQADSLVSSTFPDTRWADGTAATLRRLGRTTPRLVLLGDTPRADREPSTCLAAHLDDVGACALRSDAGLEAEAGDYAHLPGRHRAVADAVSVVDLVRVPTEQWFCRGERCPAVVGDTLVYRDEAHPTQRYIRQLEPLLARALDPLTTKGPRS